MGAYDVLPASRHSIVDPVGVATAEGLHLFPFRTEKLSPPAPMVLPGTPGGRVGRRPLFVRRPGADRRRGVSFGAGAGAGRAGSVPAGGQSAGPSVPGGSRAGAAG